MLKSKLLNKRNLALIVLVLAILLLVVLVASYQTTNLVSMFWDAIVQPAPALCGGCVIPPPGP